MNYHKGYKSLLISVFSLITDSTVQHDESIENLYECHQIGETIQTVNELLVLFIRYKTIHMVQILNSLIRMKKIIPNENMTDEVMTYKISKCVEISFHELLENYLEGRTINFKQKIDLVSFDDYSFKLYELDGVHEFLLTRNRNGKKTLPKR